MYERGGGTGWADGHYGARPLHEACTLPNALSPMHSPQCTLPNALSLHNMCTLTPQWCALSLHNGVLSLSTMVCSLSPQWCALSLLICTHALSSTHARTLSLSLSHRSPLLSSLLYSLFSSLLASSLLLGSPFLCAALCPSGVIILYSIALTHPGAGGTQAGTPHSGRSMRACSRCRRSLAHSSRRDFVSRTVSQPLLSCVCKPHLCENLLSGRLRDVTGVARHSIPSSN